MRATIERATLLKCLSHVQSVVERRNTIPILSNVLIEASEGGKIKVTATDLDLQVVETFAADVETPGTTTVSAHTLFEIARKLPDGSQVQLHAADGRMAVNAGRARFSLATLPRDDFPTIAEGDGFNDRKGHGKLHELADQHADRCANYRKWLVVFVERDAPRRQWREQPIYDRVEQPRRRGPDRHAIGRDFRLSSWLSPAKAPSLPQRCLFFFSQTIQLSAAFLLA